MLTSADLGKLSTSRIYLGKKSVRKNTIAVVTLSPGGPNSDFLFIFHFSIFVFHFLIFTTPFSFSVEISVFIFYFSVFVFNVLIFISPFSFSVFFLLFCFCVCF